MAEVALAIIPLVFSVLRSVEMVVYLSDRSRNAPRQVRQLKVVLSKLSEDLAYFQNQDNPDGHSWIPVDAQTEISRALVDCRAVLEKHYSNATRNRALSGMRQAFWRLSNGAELDRYQTQISDFYTMFVIPGLIRIGHKDGVSILASGESRPRAQENLHLETAESTEPKDFQVQMESFKFHGTPSPSREAGRTAESLGRRARILNLETREASSALTTRVDHIPQTETVLAGTTFGEVINAEL